MGDISCSRAFSVPSDEMGLGSAGVLEAGTTPQSSRSGRLSSSSPAQSIWLPGVDGRWSMAKARTCSTSESTFVLVEKDVTVGPAERCGGASFDADALGGPGTTPQSFRSGRLSSSSPAQSIWLPGVDGRWSMAKARTCSTSESMFVFVEKDVTVGPAERCGGASFDADALGGP